MGHQQQHEPAALIGLDWGTTSLRAYRIGSGGVDGAVLERREAARGILAVAGGDFAGALAEVAGDWLSAEPGVPVLASGMIGSRQGWREVPYAACPAGAAELAQGLAEVAGPGGSAVRLVPGLQARDAAGVPDVMRGEETQILGELAARGGVASSRFVLPGTHSKWAAVEGGRILSFATYMTGEVFDVLRRHSILGRLMRDGAPHDPDAFRRGLDRARAPEPEATAAGGGRLLHDLFGARTLGLAGDLPEPALASYLSGLLIGAEIAAASGVEVGEPVTVTGSGALTALYLDALGHLGVPAAAGTPDSAARGLLVLARAAGLVEGDHA